MEKATKETGSLLIALGLFQSECPAIKKQSTAGGGKFSYKYGGLPHILETIKPHMKKAGLCFTQPIITVDGIEYLMTIIYHSATGEKIESQVALPQVEFQQMNVVQSKGAIISYIRRYAIMSILGLVTEDDDTDAAGETKKIEAKKDIIPEKKWLNSGSKEWQGALKYLNEGGKISEIKKKYKISKANEETLLNDAMIFDDLPFDKEDAEDNEIMQPNTNFENK